MSRTCMICSEQTHTSKECPCLYEMLKEGFFSGGGGGGGHSHDHDDDEKALASTSIPAPGFSNLGLSPQELSGVKVESQAISLTLV